MDRDGAGGVGEMMATDPPSPNDDLGAVNPEDLRESSTPIDWVRADLKDQWPTSADGLPLAEGRTLTWYVDRAEEGDQRAAMRALQLCAQSLSPAALRQTGMRIDHLLSDALLRILGSGDDLGDSRLLKVARGKKGGRGKVETVNNAKWWLCYEMHRLLQSQPKLTQDQAAERVLSDPDLKYEIPPDSLRRAYSELLPSISVYFLETQDDAGIHGPWRMPDVRPEK